jgi:hypothetical protein
MDVCEARVEHPRLGVVRHAVGSTSEIAIRLAVARVVRVALEVFEEDIRGQALNVKCTVSRELELKPSFRFSWVMRFWNLA